MLVETRSLYYCTICHYSCVMYTRNF